MFVIYTSYICLTKFTLFFFQVIYPQHSRLTDKEVSEYIALGCLLLYFCFYWCVCVSIYSFCFLFQKTNICYLSFPDSNSGNYFSCGVSVEFLY